MAAFTQLQTLVLQGMFQSRWHPAATVCFGGASLTPRVVAMAGSAQSQVLVQEAQLQNCHGGFEVLAWL